MCTSFAASLVRAEAHGPVLLSACRQLGYTFRGPAPLDSTNRGYSCSAARYVDLFSSSHHHLGNNQLGRSPYFRVRPSLHRRPPAFSPAYLHIFFPCFAHNLCRFRSPTPGSLRDTRTQNLKARKRPRIALNLVHIIYAPAKTQ